MTLSGSFHAAPAEVETFVSRHSRLLFHLSNPLIFRPVFLISPVGIGLEIEIREYHTTDSLMYNGISFSHFLERSTMDLHHLIDTVKAHPDFGKAGMILSHNGIVRATSRDGRPVSGIKIRVDRTKLQQILEASRQKQGIVDIQVELAEEDRFLAIGEDVMFIVVAGDIREHVIETLTETLNAIKATVTTKTEFFIEGPSHE